MVIFHDQSGPGDLTTLQPMLSVAYQQTFGEHTIAAGGQGGFCGLRQPRSALSLDPQECVEIPQPPRQFVSGT